MQFLLLGRIAKIVALLGFFLPWITVSCSGTDILEATGLQLMTGDVQAAQGLPGASGSSAAPEGENQEPNLIVVAAFAALALGLFGALLTKGKAAAGVLLAGALVGGGLSYYAVENLRQELVRSMHDAQAQQATETGSADVFTAEQQTQMTQAMASAIQVNKQEGFWLTLGGAALAAVFAALALAGETPAHRPEELAGG